MDAANLMVQKPADWEAVRRERDGQLRQIAKAGKQWRNTLGRTIDMEGSCRFFPVVLEFWVDLMNSVRLSTMPGVCEALGRRSGRDEFCAVIPLTLGSPM